MKLDQLIQGDAIQILPNIPSNFVDCICIDPPYGINYYSII